MLHPKRKQYTIRRAVLADDVLLAEMGERTFINAYAKLNTPEVMETYLESAFSPKIQRREIADPKTIFLIAEYDGIAVGFVKLEQDHAHRTVTAENPIELVRIYADLGWIGEGVGTALIEACFRFGAQEGHDVIWLGVWRINTQAIEFYKKVGFEVVGKKTFQMGSEQQSDLVMARRINNS